MSANGVPVLPVVEELKGATSVLPACLHAFNALEGGDAGVERIATALLECVGLLPRQRRVFLSYRRDESRAAALQLFDELSANQFDVFLDTHGVPPADDFQSVLWHRLCDADLLLMLDTSTYFESRWTAAEFGRALAKQIPILRVAWPSVGGSRRVETTTNLELAGGELARDGEGLTEAAIQRVVTAVERVRGEGLAARHVNFVGGLRASLAMIGGSVTGIGRNRAIYIRLADGRQVVVNAAIGVPTSVLLHDASEVAEDCASAVVYDHVGLRSDWIAHLDWLGEHIKTARWVRSSEAAWDFAAWEA
jgi:hypothetical protein